MAWPTLAATEPRVRAAAGYRAEVDPETLAACRRGDRAALTRFVRTYERAVFAFLSRTVGPGPHVEDLAQEVFLRAYRALPQFRLRPDARVSTWLLKIAVHLSRDHQKKKRIRVVTLDAATVVPGGATQGPEHHQRRKEIASALEHATAQLSDDHRTVFLLAHFHERSMGEIAELTGVPEATVKTRLHRARARLRALLAPLRDGSPEETS